MSFANLKLQSPNRLFLDPGVGFEVRRHTLVQCHWMPFGSPGPFGKSTLLEVLEPFGYHKPLKIELKSTF